MEISVFFENHGGILGFIWGCMFVSSYLVVVVVVVVVLKWRNEY